MKKMMNRLCSALLCFVMLMALLPMQVSAAIPVDNGKKCSLQIVFVPDNIKASGVKFSAYKVASVTASYEFKVEPKFAEQEVTRLLENPDAESYSLIASTLSGVIASDSTIKSDYTALTDSSGNARFENMGIGLYLIIGEVYNGEKAYYIPQNFMVSLPERNNDDLWNYDVLAFAKWEKQLKNDSISLEVLKVWSDSAVNLHADDSVTVNLYMDDALYDTIILNKNNNWCYKWDNLKSGAKWTVKENDIKGYTSTVERSGNRFVVTNVLQKPIKEPDTLPQTGLLWWPVPMLTALGILFMLIGLYIKRKGEKQ